MGELDTPEYGSRRRARIARAILLTVASGGVLLLASLRVVHAGARLASSRAARADVVLVPGHRLERGEVGRFYDERLRRAYALWRRDPRRLLLLSGGSWNDAGPTEAVGGLAHLADLGLPPSATVLLEGDALDTEQNLLLSARRLREAGIGTEGVVLVSNRWHLARCAWLAEHHGLPLRVCAAEVRWTPGLLGWLALLREAASLLSHAGYDALRIDARRLLRPKR
jgi:uncharacterized SAM-binding protein YcdF (DUF218 family)